MIRTTRKLIFILSALFITILIVWIVRFYSPGKEERFLNKKDSIVREKEQPDKEKIEKDKPKVEKNSIKKTARDEIYCELSGEVFYIVKPSKKIPIKNGTVSLKRTSGDTHKIYIDEIDENGSYKIGGVPTGEYLVSVQYSDENLSGVYSRLIVIPLQKQFRHDIKIPTCKIIGKIIDKWGGVVSDASVLCFKKGSSKLIYPLDWSENFCNLSVSDKKGSFEITNNGTIGVGEYIIYVRKENFGFAFKNVSVEDEDGVVETLITLSEESIVEGRVVTASEGEVVPIADALVYAVRRELSFPVWINNSETTTDEDGNYKISGLSEGSYDLFIYTQKNGQTKVEGIYLKQGDHFQKDIFLNKAPVILRFIIKDSQTREELDRFKIEIFYKDSTPVFLSESTEIYGQYEEILSPGDYKILVESQGYERYETSISLKAGEEEKVIEILMGKKRS